MGDHTLSDDQFTRTKQIRLFIYIFIDDSPAITKKSGESMMKRLFQL
jgi:hypothetical protein